MKGLIVLFCITIICFFSFGTIDEGERGLKVTLGKINNKLNAPGIYIKMPIITKMEKFSIRTIREDSDIETYTKDLQIARLKISLSCSLKEADIMQFIPNTVRNIIKSWYGIVLHNQ